MSEGVGRPPGARRSYELETPALTAAFWGATALFTAAFFVTPYLPLIDYHQHVAIGALMHALFASGASEHALYDVNLITYNGGFHVLVALLAYAMPAELAGKVVMAAFPALFSAAALAVARQARRPRWFAFLALPITYSHGMAWGFANWNLTFPVAVLATTWWLRYARGERGMRARLLAASMYCAYGHVLAMLCFCVAIGVAQLARIRSLAPTWSSRFVRLAATPLPVLPGVLWCIFVYFYQTRASFSNWAEAQFDGTDDPLWFKLRHLVMMSVGNFADASDNAMMVAALASCAVLAFAGEPEATSEAEPELRAMRWLAVTFFGCYLVVPKVFVATWFVYERFPPIAMLFLVGALPRRVVPRLDELRAATATLAVAAGANTLRAWATMGEANDASRAIDLIGPGHRVVGVTYDPTPERFTREVFVHLPAVYQARTLGEIAYTFTKFESMPVHYKPGKAPPSGPGGFEWNASLYEPRRAWTHAYDRALVHAPAGMDDPRGPIFRELAPRVALVARRGRFFIYDTSALAEGATAGE